MRRLLVPLAPLLATAVLATGCAGADPEETAVPATTTSASTTPVPTGTTGGVRRTAVDWNAYAPSLRNRVERFEDQRACRQLQQVRAKAAAGTINTGTAAADAGLIAYLDEALSLAAC